MTHVVHPYAHRLGILRDWKSRWFARGKNYSGFLREDVLVREYLEKTLKGFYVAGIEIERNNKAMKIIVKTARPGMIIGRQGEGTIKIKAGLEKMMKKSKISASGVRIEIEEVRFPETNAAVVGHMIVEALSKRLPFRRILKQTLDKVMANKRVLGARIEVSGRLGGAEIARSESLKRGMIPLQTLRADV